MSELKNFLDMLNRAGEKYMVVEDFEVDTTTVSLENYEVADIRVDVEFRFDRFTGRLARTRVREG